MKTTSKLKSYLREFKFLAKGVLSTKHPILAHVIPMRRCNLACTYCNEYDDTSKPVPTAVMFKRLDKLASLGTTAIIISGGEPLMHPEIENIIRRIRHHGMLACLITNGYLLTEQRIKQLNQAGLEYMQISIDNLKPDEVSKKSLKVLDKKLVWLSKLARFRVNINSVIGGGIKTPEDALIIIPKRNTVLFPGVISPITVGRIGSVAAAQEAVRSEKKVGFLLQRDPQKNDVTPEDLFWVGTAGQVVRYITGAEGTHHLVVQGQSRFRVLEFLPGWPFLVARAQMIESKDDSNPDIEARFLQLKAQAVEAIGLLPSAPNQRAHAWVELDGRDVGPPPGQFGHEEMARLP